MKFLKTGIRSLKIGFNRVFGYYIDIEIKSFLCSAELYQKADNRERRKIHYRGFEKQEELILNAEERIINLEQQIYGVVLAIISTSGQKIQETASESCCHRCSKLFCKCRIGIQLCNTKDGQLRNYLLSDSRHPVIERIQAGFVQ